MSKGLKTEAAHFGLHTYLTLLLATSLLLTNLVLCVKLITDIKLALILIIMRLNGDKHYFI